MTTEAFLRQPRTGQIARSRVVRWLPVCIALAIVAGIFFRFYHIDRKVYWDDEVFTSLHVLGITEGDVVAQSPELTSAGALRIMLHPGPSHVHHLADTIRSLAIEDPHHTPLYYVLAYEWVRLFGDATATIRAMSAVIGVCAIPCMYWLCLELFGSARAAGIGAALLAISPFSVLYSQEAREYALWTFAILVMSATFVRAIRQPTIASWIGYGAALSLALYVFAFSLFLALGNLIVVFSLKAIPPGPRRAYPLAATAGALILFSPWLLVMAGKLAQISKSMSTTTTQRQSAGHIMRLFATLFRLDVVDLNVLHQASLNMLMLAPIVAFLAYAVFFLCRSADLPVRLFIIVMMVCSSAPLVLPDLLISGNRTLNPRYFSPLYVALDLTLVYLFATKLAPIRQAASRRPVWATLFGLLLVARLVSCSWSSQATTWWNKYNEQSIAVAHVINTAAHPVLLTDNFIEFTLSLSNYLDDRVELDLRPRCYQCSLTSGGPLDVTALERTNDRDTFFLLGPSARLLDDVRTATRGSKTQSYFCIDVRSNCASEIHLW